MPPQVRSTVHTPDAPAAIGPYSQAVRAGGLLWCSGQLGMRADGTWAGSTAAEQAEQCLRNLDALCREAGTGLSRALKLTIYCTNLADFAAINTVYATHFEAPFPARATVQVAALPKGGLVEIDAVVEL